MDDVLARIKESVVRFVSYVIDDVILGSGSHSSAPVLNAVMNSFKPEYVAQRALMFADMVKDCEDTGLPKVGNVYMLYS